MKQTLIRFVLSIGIACSFSNCEKDDICAEGTPVTPRIIIEFYNAAQPTVLKNITALGVIDPNSTSGIAFLFQPTLASGIK